MSRLAAMALAGMVGAAICWLAIGVRLRYPAPRRTRVNWRGRPVPAVLGEGLVIGGAAALMPGLAADVPGIDLIAGTMALVMVIMAGAGLWDDLRGAERARGFSGHVQALRGGGVTGGIVKLAAGALAGVAAGRLLAGESLVLILEVTLLVGLGANAVNLFDRAPGRALKVALLVGVPLLVWGNEVWALAATGLIAAALVCVPFDLAERAMLGDAGANPLGAALGLGLFLSLPEPWRLVAIAMLVFINVASEVVSFSAVIERSRVLAWLDRAGRTRGA